MARPRVLLLIGIPGSGKSTWAQRHAAATLSSDATRLLLSGDETNQQIHSAVFGTLRHLLRERLKLQMPLTLIDATNLRRKDRKPFLKIAAQFGADAEAVHFDVPLDVALARNRNRSRIVPEDVIRLMHSRLQAPTEAEGFAKITTISS